MGKKVYNPFFCMSHIDSFNRLINVVQMSEMKILAKLATRASGTPYNLIGSDSKEMAEECECSEKTIGNAFTKFKKLNIVAKHKGFFYLNPTLFYSGKNWDMCKGWWAREFETLLIGAKEVSE